MADKTITRERLKEIVHEELDKMIEEASGVDHDSIRTIVNGASVLLKAFDKFESKATETMMSSLGQPLNKLKQTLEDMVRNPSNYVMVPKKVRKVVSLQPASASKKPSIPQPG